ncbi:MAG TPA: DUF4148 domain-containing protein [Caldimonas sp.]
MKTVSSIALAGLLAAFATGFAVAQPKTREEVRAEAASAARAGQIDRGEVTTVPPAQSVRARAEVKAETRAAVKAGAIDRGEVTRVPAPKPSTKTRAEVKAEAASAIRPKPVVKVEDSSAKKQ